MGSRLKQFSVGKVVIYECEPQKCGDILHIFFFPQKFVPVNGEEKGIGDSDNRACSVCVCVCVCVVCVLCVCVLCVCVCVRERESGGVRFRVDCVWYAAIEDAGICVL